MGLTRLLLRFFHERSSRHLGEYSNTATQDCCTTIQLNRNYAAREHVDRNNLGPSWIIACGNWTNGGDLWIRDNHGHAEHTMTCSVKASRGERFMKGERIR